MTVRTSNRFTYTPTGPTTVVAKRHSEHNTHETPDIRRQPSIVDTSAFVATLGLVCRLLGLHNLSPSPEPRNKALPAPNMLARGAGSADKTAHKFTSAQRQRESGTIMKTSLFMIVGPAGIFIGCVTEKVPHESIQPSSEHTTNASRHAIQASSRASASVSRRSWVDDLSSRAGSEASGLPLFWRPSVSSAEANPAETTRERVVPAESQERPVEETGISSETWRESGEPERAAPQHSYEAYAEALNIRPADETESPAAQPRTDFESDPQVFARYANALAEEPVAADITAPDLSPPPAA